MIIVSLGGNALIRRGERGSTEDQFRNAALAMSAVASVVDEKTPLIITHGNGPVVGNIMLRSEAAKDIVPPSPLFICDADSEGGIGFMIQQTLYNELRRIRSSEEVVAVVTQVVVDPRDPAFKKPTKPIGSYYDEAEAIELGERRGWTLARVSTGGFRRVVPSPRPVRIVEAEVIKKLALSGVIVIAAGGGGVPVVEGADLSLSGIDCVVDKDLATSALGRECGAEKLIIITDVDYVYLDYASDDRRPITQMTAAEARGFLKAGHFAPGSMRPKVEAAIEFLEGGGKSAEGDTREVLITSPENVERALGGEAGTSIVP